MAPVAAPEQVSHLLSAYGPERSTISGTPLNTDELRSRVSPRMHIQIRSRFSRRDGEKHSRTWQRPYRHRMFRSPIRLLRPAGRPLPSGPWSFARA